VGSFVFSLDKVFLRAKLLLSPPFHPHSSGSDFFAQCSWVFSLLQLMIVPFRCSLNMALTSPFETTRADGD
jgi:hypothetical protein